MERLTQIHKLAHNLTKPIAQRYVPFGKKDTFISEIEPLSVPSVFQATIIRPLVV